MSSVPLLPEHDPPLRFQVGDVPRVAPALKKVRVLPGENVAERAGNWRGLLSYAHVTSVWIEQPQLLPA
jgi:hypothetical protein